MLVSYFKSHCQSCLPPCMSSFILYIILKTVRSLRIQVLVLDLKNKNWPLVSFFPVGVPQALPSCWFGAPLSYLGSFWTSLVTGIWGLALSFRTLNYLSYVEPFGISCHCMTCLVNLEIWGGGSLLSQLGFCSTTWDREMRVLRSEEFKSWEWRWSSVVRSIYCSYRWPQLSFHHTMEQLTTSCNCHS